MPTTEALGTDDVTVRRAASRARWPMRPIEPEVADGGK